MNLLSPQLSLIFPADSIYSKTVGVGEIMQLCLTNSYSAFTEIFFKTHESEGSVVSFCLSISSTMFNPVM